MSDVLSAEIEAAVIRRALVFHSQASHKYGGGACRKCEADTALDRLVVAARAGGCAADALGRLVADLETNSERGAPDYAHDALAAYDRAVSGQTAEKEEA